MPQALPMRRLATVLLLLPLLAHAQAGKTEGSFTPAETKDTTVKGSDKTPPTREQLDRIGKTLGAESAVPQPVDKSVSDSLKSGLPESKPGNTGFTPAKGPQDIPVAGSNKTPPSIEELDRIGKGLGAAPSGALPVNKDVADAIQSGRGDATFELTMKIQALEARLAALEKGVFKAPFTVLGNGGKPVLRLSSDGFLLLGFDGGNQIGLLAQPGAAPARIGVQSGSNVAQMVAGEGKAVIEVLHGEAVTAGLTASPQLVGVLVEKDGIPAARLGSLPGKGVALRLYDKGGKQVAAAGENPATPGTGLVAVGNGSRNGAALAANEDGSGVAHAFAADGTVGSGLIGKDRMVAAYNASGNAVVTIGKSENSEGGNVTSRDPAGDGVFRAGFNSAVGGGDACVFRAKKQQTYCLGLGVPGVGLVGR